MIYLYVKKHKVTGLKYFGKTKRNPYTYHGSGLYWKRHLSKYGYEVETISVWEFENLNECSEFALFYSSTNNVVESSDWANLKLENGLDGGFFGNHTDETKHKMRKQKKNKDNMGQYWKGKHLSEEHKSKIAAKSSLYRHTKESKEKISLARRGKPTKRKGVSLPKVSCPLCGIHKYTAPGLARYHAPVCTMRDK